MGGKDREDDSTREAVSVGGVLKLNDGRTGPEGKSASDIKVIWHPKTIFIRLRHR